MKTKIKVPATSANMGPGFDCLGIALGLYNTVTIEEYDGETTIRSNTAGFDNKDNLIYTSMIHCFEEIGYNPKGILLNCHTEIPVSRGLGSSAACIAAGVAGANRIAGNPLSMDEILFIGSKLEGHPDNIAPALLGGMVVSIMDQGKVFYEKLRLKNEYRFYALIPDFKLSTADSRAVLPECVPYKDSSFNIGRVSLLVAAMYSGNKESIKASFEDRLHQPYRGKLISGYDSITTAAKKFGALGVFLSGAGPTVMTLTENDNEDFEKNMNTYIQQNHQGWELKCLKRDLTGIVLD